MVNLTISHTDGAKYIDIPQKTIDVSDLKELIASELNRLLKPMVPVVDTNIQIKKVGGGLGRILSDEETLNGNEV